jgi:hypothetical protein
MAREDPVDLLAQTERWLGENTNGNSARSRKETTLRLASGCDGPTAATILSWKTVVLAIACRTGGLRMSPISAAPTVSASMASSVLVILTLKTTFGCCTWKRCKTGATKLSIRSGRSRHRPCRPGYLVTRRYEIWRAGIRAACFRISLAGFLRLNAASPADIAANGIADLLKF